MKLEDELAQMLWEVVRSDPLSEAVEKGEIAPEAGTAREDLIVPGFSLCFRIMAAQRHAILRLAGEIDNLRTG